MCIRDRIIAVTVRARQFNNIYKQAMEDKILEKKIGESGEVLVKEYQKEKFLGKGGFARCYEIKEIDTGKIFAAKIIEKSTLNKEKSRQKLLSEISIHKAMRHPSIVHFERYFEDDQRVYMLLELCPNQSLKEMLRRRKRFHELEVQFYLAQLIAGLKYIHGKNVIHRDLKLGNLLVGRNMELKIGDFGLAARLSFAGERRRTVCGTPNYMAPEVLNSKVCGHSFEADVWSIGVIVYAMLVGKTPFDSSDVKQTYKRVKANDYSIPEEADLSSEAKSLIADLLKVNPAQRLSLNGIMQHSFMAKNATPKFLPLKSLAHPLTDDFINHYVSRANKRNTLKSQGASGQERQFEALKENTGYKQTELLKTLKNRPLAPEKPNVADTPKRLLQTNYHLASLARSHMRSTKLLLETRKSAITPKASSRVSANQKISLANTPMTNSRTEKAVEQNFTAELKKLGSVADKGTLAEYVAYFQDYTEKYGLAYMLTNGMIGFHYNDMTNILWIKNKEQYVYADYYAKTEVVYISRQDCKGKLSKDLEKKRKLVDHFIVHCSKAASEGKLQEAKDSVADCSVALKRVIKTRKGMLFRLTNNVIQMLFIDKSQLILSFNSKTLLYIDKSGNREQMRMTRNFLTIENDKILKRFEYTMGVVNCLNSNKGNYRAL
eukprot:TRINITY_DN5763_c0_g1_i16.p1 TRINITY_DN5763_c0_g1~~TRINITY_DN5763_c0_g1_i16.p1  ORF type:complete len:662 (+),score=216.02 TRINITY_DN5763_c0_g1_i16:76-2061(+)